MHDCRIDGLRVDSTAFIRNVKGNNDDPEHDLPEGWQLLQQINSIAHKINPSALTIAEDIAYNDFITKPVNDGGAGFNCQWELNFPFALREVLKNRSPSNEAISAVADQLVKNFNNDLYERVVYADSHDSAANGHSRLVESISPGKTDSLFARQQALLAATLLLCAPGIPMLFQGQELMQGGSFNDWEGLNWKLAERHIGIVTAFMHLIALRKNSYGNSRGLSGRNVELHNIDLQNKVIIFRRWDQGGPGDDTLVVINFSDNSLADYEIKLPHSGIWKVRFNSSWNGYAKDFKNHKVDDIAAANDSAVINLPPACALIFSEDS